MENDSRLHVERTKEVSLCTTTTVNDVIDNIIKEQKDVKDLAEFINQHNMDSESETPDFILAEMLYNFYLNYKDSIQKNIDWHSDWTRLGEH